MSDTPRTDARPEIRNNIINAIHVDFVRQLERELIAAQNQLHAMRLICGTTDASKFETVVDRLIAERDQLRQLLGEVSRSKYLDGVDWPELEQFRDQPPQPPT
jgi:hypothetical protein